MPTLVHSCPPLAVKARGAPERQVGKCLYRCGPYVVTGTLLAYGSPHMPPLTRELRLSCPLAGFMHGTLIVVAVCWLSMRMWQ